MDSRYAYRLSEAARAAKPGGDMIDHGWSLVKELHARGFTVTPVEKLHPFDRRTTLNEMCGLTKESQRDG